MIYQDPLAYVLGLEGVALLRAFNGEYGRDFTEARLAEIRTLLDSADQLGEAAVTRPITTVEGYRSWAGRYDQPGNGLIDLEQPVVREILDGLPCGTALDAACGTGRHAGYLAAHGHTVIGVDSSPGMLAVADGSSRPPTSTWRSGSPAWGRSTATGGSRSGRSWTHDRRRRGDRPGPPRGVGLAGNTAETAYLIRRRDQLAGP